MHDGESVGITERCNESEPDAQGGDEMIHPVGFAGTRIIGHKIQSSILFRGCEKAANDLSNAAFSCRNFNSSIFGWGGRI